MPVLLVRGPHFENHCSVPRGPLCLDAGVQEKEEKKCTRFSEIQRYQIEMISLLFLEILSFLFSDVQYPPFHHIMGTMLVVCMYRPQWKSSLIFGKILQLSENQKSEDHQS